MKVYWYPYRIVEVRGLLMSVISDAGIEID